MGSAVSPSPSPPVPDNPCPPSGRQEFDSDRCPDLQRDVYLQDIHCVSSLCKAYFRELPNPLLTYQLYDKFAVRPAAPGPGGGFPRRVGGPQEGFPGR